MIAEDKNDELKARELTEQYSAAQTSLTQEQQEFMDIKFKADIQSSFCMYITEHRCQMGGKIIFVRNCINYKSLFVRSDFIFVMVVYYHIQIAIRYTGYTSLFPDHLID